MLASEGNLALNYENRLLSSNVPVIKCISITSTMTKTAIRSSKRKIVSANKKLVRFSESSTLIITRFKSREELKSLWHSRHELKELKQNANSSLRRILRTRTSDAKAYIKKSLGDNTVLGANTEEFVGVEHALSAHICNALCLARSKSIHDILEEQTRQRKLGIRDVDAMAEVSRNCSEFPRRWRYQVALVNAAED